MKPRKRGNPPEKKKRKVRYLSIVLNETEYSLLEIRADKESNDMNVVKPTGLAKSFILKGLGLI